MKLLKWTALLLVGAYFLVATLAYAFQNRLIFHPRLIDADATFDWGQETFVKTEDGDSLSLVWVNNPGDEVVLYLHGNVGDANRGRYQVRRLIDESDYDVVVADYRGYGKSSGTLRDDSQLLSDAQAMYDAVAAHYPESKIRVLGYSLGTGMATYLAAENRPAHLTLVAPYTSLVDMKNQAFWWLPNFLLNYRLDTRSRIADVRCPIDIYHGTADRLIPFEMAEELARLSPKQATLHPLEGGSHRGAILAFEEGWVE